MNKVDEGAIISFSFCVRGVKVSPRVVLPRGIPLVTNTSLCHTAVLGIVIILPVVEAGGADDVAVSTEVDEGAYWMAFDCCV
jgi:hypothetical protein